MPTAPLHREAGSFAVPAVALTLLALAAVPLQAQEPPRALGNGFSVPIPAGFHVDSTSTRFGRRVWRQGGMLLAHDSASGYRTVAIVPADVPPTPDELPQTVEGCREQGTGFARATGIEFAGAVMAETPQGPRCQLTVIDREDPHKGVFTFMFANALGFGVTCNTEIEDDGVPPWCREVIDGWRTEQAPSEGEQRIPRYDPQEPAPAGDVFVQGVVDEVPQIVSSPPLQYPPDLLQANIEGSVTLAAVVGTDGKIEPGSIRVVESTHPGFEQAAADALLAMVLRPGKINGRPVRVLVQLPIEFHLQRKP